MSNVVSLADFRAGKAQLAPTPAVKQVAALPAVADIPAAEGFTHTVEGVESFNYGYIMSCAMLGVVRELLAEVSLSGLPPKSQFYISFDTQAVGVEIPDHLKDAYPVEMTIMLDQWWEDLIVGNDGFEVTLNFSNAKSALKIPFSALISFADPGEGFGLCFKANRVDQTAVQ